MYRQLIAVLFDSVLAFKDDIIGVMVVPIFCPKITGIAVEKGMLQVNANACKTPTDAEEDWIIAVNAVPNKIPIIGLEKTVSIRVKASLSFKPSIAPLIASMPNISTAKPIRI